MPDPNIDILEWFHQTTKDKGPAHVATLALTLLRIAILQCTGPHADDVLVLIDACAAILFDSQVR